MYKYENGFTIDEVNNIKKVCTPAYSDDPNYNAFAHNTMRNVSFIKMSDGSYWEKGNGSVSGDSLKRSHKLLTDDKGVKWVVNMCNGVAHKAYFEAKINLDGQDYRVVRSVGNPNRLYDNEQLLTDKDGKLWIADTKRMVAYERR